MKCVHFANLQTRWVFGGRVSTYFYDAFLRIWNSGMSGDFLMLTRKFPNYEIWVGIRSFDPKNLLKTVITCR